MIRSAGKFGVVRRDAPVVVAVVVRVPVGVITVRAGHRPSIAPAGRPDDPGRGARAVLADPAMMRLVPMFDDLALPFVQHGLVEVAVLSVAAGLAGTWIVLRGLAFYAHAVGTAAFPGLVLADGLGFGASLGAFGTAMLVAGLVAWLARREPGREDALTALVLVAALAVGVVLASDVFHSGANVDSLLFGSLLTIGTGDILLAAVASVVMVAVTLVLGPRWLATGFERGLAEADRTAGATDLVLLVLVAFVAVAALSAVGALLATALLVPPYWAPLTWQDGVPHPHGTDAEGHRWVGAEAPAITVEEFVDYGCPHCAVATNLTRRRLAAHADALRVIRRHQPRMRCHEANRGCLTLRAVECAGQQGKFWEMDAWLFTHAPGKVEVDVVEGARALALDEPSFVSCLQDPATYEWADRESKTARKLKIDMTPTYRVDGRVVTPRELDAMLDERL